MCIRDRTRHRVNAGPDEVVVVGRSMRRWRWRRASQDWGLMSASLPTHRHGRSVRSCLPQAESQDRCASGRKCYVSNQPRGDGHVPHTRHQWNMRIITIWNNINQHISQTEACLSSNYAHSEHRMWLSVCVPAHVAEWLPHSTAMCSKAWSAQWPRFASQPRLVRLPKNYFL